MECLTQQLLKVSRFAGWKKSHCTKQGLIIRGYSLCQNSALIIRNGIRNVRKGVDIFDKKLLIPASSSRTQCFRIRPCLHQSFPCSRQSINRYHSAWCTLHNLSGFYFLCFNFPCFWQEGRGREKTPPPFSALLFSFFQVLSCNSTQGSVQPQETGELYKNLTVLCSHDVYTWNQI